MDDKSDSYVLDDQIGYLLRLAGQRHSGIFQAMMIEKLTPTQFSALIRISEQGQCSQNHLGRLAAMDVATIKGVVQRLTQRGLTRLDADPTDKRRTLISLTPKGNACVAQIQPIGHHITTETLAPLTPTEQRTLTKLLGKLT